MYCLYFSVSWVIFWFSLNEISGEQWLHGLHSVWMSGHRPGLFWEPLDFWAILIGNTTILVYFHSDWDYCIPAHFETILRCITPIWVYFPLHVGLQNEAVSIAFPRTFKPFKEMPRWWLHGPWWHSTCQAIERHRFACIWLWWSFCRFKVVIM